MQGSVNGTGSSLCNRDIEDMNALIGLAEVKQRVLQTQFHLVKSLVMHQLWFKSYHIEQRFCA